MSDALVIVAPVPGAYPSVNHLGSDGHRGGKKTPEYHDLFEAVKTAAEAEIARTGWTMAEYLCDTTIVFYHRDQRKRDALNLGKCECDALTAAGVWLDDHLGHPAHADLEYDPAGPNRVLIIVRRRFPVFVATTSAILTTARRRAAAAPTPPVAAPALPASHAFERKEKFAEVNGRRVPLEQALAEIFKRT